MAKNTNTRDETETYFDRKKAKQAECTKKFGNLNMHYATVTGGRKLEKDTEVEVIWVGVNKYLGMSAQVIAPDHDKPVWMNPAHLKAGKPLPKKQVAEIEEERTREREATCLIPGIVRSETDKGVIIAYDGWFKAMSFPKADVTKTGAELEDGREIFEIPQWKVKSERGQDALDALLAKQGPWEELVEETTKPKGKNAA